MISRRIVAIGVAAVVVVTAAWMLVERPLSRVPEPSVVTPSAEAPQPSDDPANPASELAAIAWWDTGSFDFGIIPEAPQPDLPPASPGGYRQLRVGTLDGRVTAIRTLPSAWSHSYVSGPVDGDVLVVADDGEGSVVSSITAATGAELVLFETDEIIPAAVVSPVDGAVWYIKLNRGDGADLGLWRQAQDGIESERVIPGPLGAPFDEDRISIWQLLFHPNGRWLAAQWCFGEVRCTTHVMDTATRDLRSTDALGWWRGFTDSHLVARAIGGGDAVQLDPLTFERSDWSSGAFDDAVTVKAGGSWWLVGSQGAGAGTSRLHLVPEAVAQDVPGDGDIELTEFHVPFEAGVGPLPGGWTLRWPVAAIGTWPEEGDPPHGELINVATGVRIGIPPFVPVLDRPECPILAPSQTPEGAPIGPFRSELRDGTRYVRWSQGSDAVTLAVGAPVIGRPSELGDMAATMVRGQPARVVPIGDEGVGEVALVWDEDGCTYTAWLAAGTTIDVALEYASRY